MKGKDLQKGVIDLAHTLRWHCAHFPTVKDSNGRWRTAVAADAKGWPDVFLLRDRAVVIEIKGDGDTMSEEQEQWREWFQKAGIEHYVIRPADWPDTVKEILT